MEKEMDSERDDVYRMSEVSPIPLELCYDPATQYLPRVRRENLDAGQRGGDSTGSWTMVGCTLPPQQPTDNALGIQTLSPAYYKPPSTFYPEQNLI